MMVLNNDQDVILQDIIFKYLKNPFFIPNQKKLFGGLSELAERTDFIRHKMCTEN